ncbi:MAG: putative lipoic acid-binding regulatory protein [Patiriisocius sp.]|jgi:putative lipoic acid-binding regulatory protein
MGEDKDKLRKILDDTHDWPSVYLYKFILKGDNKRIAQIEGLFTDSAQISTKESSKGSYISISVREVAMNSDEVLVIYGKARAIEGVMVL